MSAIITDKLRIYTAQKIKEQFADADITKNLYMFIAKSDAWAAGDNTPDSTIDTLSEMNKVWYDMISMKKIRSIDVVHAIPRFDWDATANTKYVAYSHTDVDLYNHPTASEISAAQSNGTYTAGSVYVVTDEYNVYICLSNNNNAKSTVKPTGTSTSVFTTADGYKWKYLYTITASDILKFVTPMWIPVRTVAASIDNPTQWAVQQAAVNGSIEVVKVTNGGSGYTAVHSGTLVAGSGSGGTLPSGASASDNTYVNATIYILTGTGAGQKKKITAYTGSSRAFTTDTAWSVQPDGTSTYEILPTVTISGDGSGAEAKATVSGGVITDITITARGTNYHVASLAITGGAGSAGAGTPIITPVGGHGKDPVQELGGFFLLGSVELTYNEDDFPTANDYRRIGIVANVTNESDDAICTALTRNATKTLQLTSVSGTFNPDEIINSTSGAVVSAKVIEYGATGGGNGTLRFGQDAATGFVDFVGTQQIIGVTSGATATISSVTAEEVKRFSGQILYLDNRRPLMRSPFQSETFRIVLEF